MKARAELAFWVLALLAVVSGVGGTWLALTGHVGGLVLMAASPVLLITGITITAVTDRLGNRRTAASWDKLPAPPLPAPAEPETAAEQDETAVAEPSFAVSATGEAQRLRDAGSTEMGLVIAVSVLAVIAYYVTAAIFPAVFA